MISDIFFSLIVFGVFVLLPLQPFGYLGLLINAILLKPSRAEIDQFLSSLRQPLPFFYMGAKENAIFAKSTIQKAGTLADQMAKYASKPLTWDSWLVLVIGFVIAALPVGVAFYIFGSSLTSTQPYLQILSGGFILAGLALIYRALRFGKKLKNPAPS